jgi:hypothetical protein
MLAQLAVWSTVQGANLAVNCSSLFERMGVVQRITRRLENRKVFGSNPGGCHFFFSRCNGKNGLLFLDPKERANSFFIVIFVISIVRLTRGHLKVGPLGYRVIVLARGEKAPHFQSVCEMNNNYGTPYFSVTKMGCHTLVGT